MLSSGIMPDDTKGDQPLTEDKDGASNDEAPSSSSVPPAPPNEVPPANGSSPTALLLAGGAQPNEVEEAAADYLDRAPANVRSRLLEYSSRFSGPLPPPALLADYEKAVPGLAAQIVSMARQEQDHRHSLDREDQRIVGKNMSATANDTRVGQLLGAMVAIGVLVVAAYMVRKDYPAAAAFMTAADLGSLVGVFIYGKQRSNPEKKALTTTKGPGT